MYDIESLKNVAFQSHPTEKTAVVKQSFSEQKDYVVKMNWPILLTRNSTIDSLNPQDNFAIDPPPPHRRASIASIPRPRPDKKRPTM